MNAHLYRTPRGITLIEVLLVVVIVALLATISFPLFGHLRAKAQNVSCVGNLRILYVGASTYLLDNDMIWPQMPEEIDVSSSEEPMWEWWLEALRPYGVSKQHWICAAEQASYAQKFSESSDYYGSYIPTSYEATPNVAYMWSNQPWFIERGQFHGKDHGPNIVMPDGSIQQGPSIFPK